MLPVLHLDPMLGPASLIWPEAIAVVFDLVEPVRAGRDAVGFGREAEVKHVTDIGFRFWKCISFVLC